MMRQAVGVGVERRVGQRSGPRTPPRRRPACARPARQTARAASAGACSSRAVSLQPSQDGAALCLVQDRQAAERARRVGDRGRQQPDQALPERLDGAAIEQVAGVFQHAVEPGRLARRRALLVERDRQVELRGRRRNRLRLHREPRQARARPPPPSAASNASITWNSGCRDSDRAGLSTSTSRSNGSSACA